MFNEGRKLEGSEFDFYLTLISNEVPIESNHGTHCSSYHYKIDDKYVVTTECGGSKPEEIVVYTEVEYKEFKKPWSQKFADLKAASERNKPITVQNYLSWEIPKKGLEGILTITHNFKDGAERILSERRRQVNKEGWTAQHDDQYKNDQLVDAAMQYIGGDLIDCWPTDWDTSWYRSNDRIRDLEKAGALIAAEIDRLLRLERNDRGIVQKS